MSGALRSDDKDKVGLMGIDGDRLPTGIQTYQFITLDSMSPSFDFAPLRSIDGKGGAGQDVPDS